MDNGKIKALAEQYADKECEQSSLEDKELLQLHEDKIIEFYDVREFLLETHCIVEKNKLRELDFFGHVKRHQYGCLTKDNAEYLFGKELFNTNKQ